MNDGNFVTKHLNSINIMVSQLASIDIKMYEEDKCNAILSSFLDSWDTLIVVISSTTQSTIKF
jgi:hypothetical protein